MEDLKELLITLTKPEMAETYSRYSTKAPEPSSAQLNDCIDKQSSVKAYTEMRENEDYSTFLQQVSLCHLSGVALYLPLQVITHKLTIEGHTFYMLFIQVNSGRGLLGVQCCHNLGISHIV